MFSNMSGASEKPDTALYLSVAEELRIFSVAGRLLFCHQYNQLLTGNSWKALFPCSADLWVSWKYTGESALLDGFSMSKAFAITVPKVGLPSNALLHK